MVKKRAENLDYVQLINMRMKARSERKMAEERLAQAKERHDETNQEMITELQAEADAAEAYCKLLAAKIDDSEPVRAKKKPSTPSRDW